MRRTDREQTKEFAYEVLDKAPYMTLSMIDEEGGPYAIPLSIVRKADTLYFHCAKEGKKNIAIEKCPTVCVSAVSRMKTIQEDFTIAYKSAIATGSASLVKEKQEKREALQLICQRFTPDNMEAVAQAIEAHWEQTEVIRIDIIELAGKANIR